MLQFHCSLIQLTKLLLLQITFHYALSWIFCMMGICCELKITISLPLVWSKICVRNLPTMKVQSSYKIIYNITGVQPCTVPIRLWAIWQHWIVYLKQSSCWLRFSGLLFIDKERTGLPVLIYYECVISVNFRWLTDDAFIRGR